MENPVLGSGGGTDEYNLSCTYFSDKTYRTDYFKLNSDNSFIAEMSIKLSGNNDITFTIQNTSTKEFYKVDGSEQLTFHYVTSSYNFLLQIFLGTPNACFLPNLIGLE